jgi:hypothetical protein
MGILIHQDRLHLVVRHFEKALMTTVNDYGKETEISHCEKSEFNSLMHLIICINNPVDLQALNN